MINNRLIDQAYSDLHDICGGVKQDYFGLLYLEQEHKVPREKAVPDRRLGTLLTIFTNIFAASLNHDIIVLCHERRDWMHPERFMRKEID